VDIMRHMKFSILMLIFIFICLIFSGCLREYDEIYITDMDIMSVPKDTGTELAITSYVQNNQNTDSGSLTLKVTVEDPSTNLNVAEKQTDIGYIKSKSQSHYSLSLSVPEPGEYFIEVELLENGNVISSNGEFITVKAGKDAKEPADILLTDMNLVIKQYVDGVSKVVVDVSPGIYNQGGDSGPLTMEVRAMVDPYSVYTESDEMGIIQGSNRVRGNVQFILPKNSEYTFSINIEENGRTVVSGNVDETIRLNEITFNTPMTYSIVEEGKPPVPTAAPTKTPGFLGLTAILCLLLVFSIIVMIRNKR
jgi:hypothetical protein